MPIEELSCAQLFLSFAFDLSYSVLKAHGSVIVLKQVDLKLSIKFLSLTLPFSVLHSHSDLVSSSDPSISGKKDVQPSNMLDTKIENLLKGNHLDFTVVFRDLMVNSF